MGQAENAGVDHSGVVVGGAGRLRGLCQGAKPFLRRFRKSLKAFKEGDGMIRLIF